MWTTQRSSSSTDLHNVNVIQTEEKQQKEVQSLKWIHVTFSLEIMPAIKENG